MSTPPPVAPVADSDRYSIYQNGGASLTTLAVPFPIYGDGTDLLVTLDGNILSTTLYSLSSVSGGSTLSNLPQPVTDAVVTFSPAVTPTTVELTGAIHPRQLSMSTTPGIVRREFNQTIGYLLSICRELYRKTRLPMQLGFDASGPISSRSLYDTQAQGFRFLQTDDASSRPLLYVKNSGATADWSQGMNFQGPQGIPGAGLGGTVTSVGSGFGLTGGAITGSGTLKVDPTQFGWGLRNRLMNGAMTLDQRQAGGSYTVGVASGVNNYTLDRWYAFLSSAATGMSVSRIAQFGGSVGYCMNIGRAASSLSTSQIKVVQVLESLPSIDLQNQNVTLSFKARAGANFSSSGGVITAAIITGNGVDQSAASLAASTWTSQAQIASVNANPTLGGWFQTFSCTGAVPNAGLQIAVAFWWTPTGTAGANDWVQITDVQLELGNVPTAQVSFERRPQALELQLCQRFFQKSISQSTGTYSSVGTAGGGVGLHAGSTDSYRGVVMKLPQVMRATPTITVFDNSGAAGFISYYASAAWHNSGASSYNAVNDSTISVQANNITNCADINFDYTVSAEL